MEGLTDSKLLSEPERERLFAELTGNPLVRYGMCASCHHCAHCMSSLAGLLWHVLHMHCCFRAAQCHARPAELVATAWRRATGNSKGLTRHLALLTIRPADERGHATKLVLQPGLPECSSVVDAGEVDEINILQATMRAMERALAGVPGIPPDAVLVDGNRVPEGVTARHRECIIKGDSKCFSIAAASVLAKARPTLAPFLFGAVALEIAWCCSIDRLCLWACSGIAAIRALQLACGH